MSEFTTINPATEAVIETYQWMDIKTLNSKLKIAHQAQEQWKKQPISERAVLLKQLKKHLLAHQELAALEMANEMFKAAFLVKKTKFKKESPKATEAEILKKTALYFANLSKV